MLQLFVSVQIALARAATRLHRQWGERGQASAEYALVLLGAAAVALLIVSWATHSNKIGELFNAVLNRLKGHVER
jgi:Flp pilus assembly pilin Flp